MSDCSIHSLAPSSVTSTSSSSCPPALESLPPELVLLILAELPLTALAAAAQTCRLLRQLARTSPAPWVRQLSMAAQTADLHLRLPPGPCTSREEAAEALECLGGACGVPGRGWGEMSKVLERGFVLFMMEMPRLDDQQWKVSHTHYSPRGSTGELGGGLVFSRARLDFGTDPMAEPQRKTSEGGTILRLISAHMCLNLQEICESRFPCSILRRELAKTPPAGSSGVPARRHKGRYRELFVRTSA